MNKNYTIRILSLARTDLKEGKDWYKSKKVKGLSARFGKAVDSAVDRLQATPHAFAIRYRNTRICHTESFPYAIHFVIDETKSIISISAIIYEGRNPDLTIER